MEKAEGLVLTEVTEEHLDALYELYQEISEETPLSKELAGDRLRSIRAHHYYRVYLGFLEGQPVCTYSILIAPNLNHGGKPWAVVENVVVSRAWQGRGLGRTMMEHAMAQAVYEGCYKLALSSNAKRVGFVREGASFYIEISAEHSHYKFSGFTSLLHRLVFSYRSFPGPFPMFPGNRAGNGGASQV